MGYIRHGLLAYLLNLRGSDIPNTPFFSWVFLCFFGQGPPVCRLKADKQGNVTIFAFQSWCQRTGVFGDMAVYQTKGLEPWEGSCEENINGFSFPLF